MKWFKNSWTIVWARFLSLAGLVLTIAIDLSADPTTGAAIQSVLAKYAPLWLIAIGIATELFRRRTVNKPTDENNQIKAE